MADDDKDATEGEAPAQGKSKLLLLVLVVNLLGLVGAGVAIFFALSNSGSAAAAEPDPTEIGPLIVVDALVVNLDDPGGAHFIRASFNLELTGEERQADVEARLVPIRSAVFLHLSGLTVADTQGREQRQQLLEDLTEIVNEQIGSEDVRRMYFAEFVIQ